MNSSRKKNLPNSLQHLDISENQISKIMNIPDSLINLNISCNPIKYVDPKLWKHELVEQFCRYVSTTPNRLKLCWKFQICYQVIKLQRWWRKKNIELKTNKKYDLNRELEYKPNFGIKYFEALES